MKRFSTLQNPATEKEIREVFLPLNRNRLFPPTYAEIQCVKLQRNWAIAAAVILFVTILLILTNQNP